ncbi:hypothetical protein TRFO_30815 [Tritrichomonas foetus]|uniref:PH domain-containing protein n=1 Tax=Tritrichomonas foetus TaxID=1144522 RepID=A0A1J4JXC8_9EUKA|nr:hypothetical protein TRFO_30815 [Tritrichomonas foetus]|eukprot:OHT02190.1 hypothetical protein TRFO_30815 [Tritrichomonas foetus]
MYHLFQIYSNLCGSASQKLNLEDSFQKFERLVAKNMSDNSEIFTWLGKAPDLTENDIQIDCVTHFYPENFAFRFNEDPIKEISKIIKENKDLNDSRNLGNFLFMCPELYARSITKFIFSNKDEISKSLLYFFFSSANLEYRTIHEASRLLLSRIAFPNNQIQISIIFDAFAAAYHSMNTYSEITTKEIAQVAVSCVVFSIFKSKTDILSQNEYIKILDNVKMQEGLKKDIYECLKAKPIPIFFMFASSLDEPNYSKSGYLKKIGGAIKGKTKRWFLIDNSKFTLKYYKDETKKQILGEVELAGSVTTYVSTTKKDQEHLVIKKLNGGPIGFKISKDGHPKRSNHTEYIAYGNDTETLKSWVSACNFVSFWSILNEFTKKRKV